MWRYKILPMSDDDIFDRLHDKLNLYIGNPTSYTDIRDDIGEVLRECRIPEYKRIVAETKIVIVNGEIMVTLPLASDGSIGIDNELGIQNYGN